MRRSVVVSRCKEETAITSTAAARPQVSGSRRAMRQTSQTVPRA